MEKKIFVLTFLCFFLNIAIVTAQKSLAASSAEAIALTSTNGTDWTTAVQLPLTMTAGVKVLVEATIEVTVTSGNSNLETRFRLTDGTTFSPTVSRYVNRNYTDKGIVTVSYIFNYASATSKTFTLQHAKNVTGNRQFTSKAVITAIEIANNNITDPITLPSGQATANLVPTTSTSYESVASTSVTLENKADIYIVSSFSTSTTSTSSTGGWAIRHNNSPISEITRSILSTTAIGAGTITTLVKGVNPGTHNFDLAHKTSVGTENITTSGATISVVVLRGTIATGDDVFPSYSDFPSSTTSTVNSYSNINLATITAPSNGFTNNKFFMHASFNMAATVANVIYATYKFGSSGGTFTPFEIQRYVPVTKTGSGGLIGIVSGINQGTTINASFQHKNSGANGTLTSSNVNTIGFFLNSDPNATLSIEEELLNSNITVYPNPSKEFYIISNDVSDGETSFKFYTLTGQLVHTENVRPKTNTKVDITNWASGIYIMKATNNGINIAKKLIIE